MRQDHVAILSFGTHLSESLKATDKLEALDPARGVTVADARFMKPLDTVLLKRIAADHLVLMIVEEESIGEIEGRDGDRLEHHFFISG
mmetsp:Transcript_527/g.1241  ORF Transcript_527/g.1241 Transcript_527/m.1241 type:complete len:88 (-) Transcript_527:12-275(-)